MGKNNDIAAVLRRMQSRSMAAYDDFNVLLDLARPGLVVRHELRGAVRLRVVRVGADVLVGPQIDLQVCHSAAHGQRSSAIATLSQRTAKM